MRPTERHADASIGASERYRRWRVESRRSTAQSPSGAGIGLTMTLTEELTRAGERLFRWRSYVPLVFVPVVVAAIIEPRPLGAGTTASHVWEALCVALAIVGLLLRALTVGFVAPGTSSRTTARFKADELNTTGAYSVVRHPIYVANALIWLGINS